MKFMLMMHCPKNGYEGFAKMPKADLKANIAFMIEFNKQLRKEGVLLSAEGLADPREAKIVRAGNGREPVIDDAFPDSKQFLAGFWIIQVETPEQAYEIAARASAAPGAGGAPMNMPIEVRQAPSGPPPEFL